MEKLDLKGDFQKIKEITYEKGRLSMPEKQRSKKATPPPLNLNNTQTILMDSQHGKAGQDYLRGRMIKPETWEKYRLGFATEGRYENRIIIPITDTYFTTRATDNRKPKVLHASGEIPALFNMEALNKAESVFLVESPFDALTLIQLGYENTIGLLGISSLKDSFIDRFSRKEVLIITDNDEAGIRAREELQQKLERVDATVLQVYVPGGKDINEAYQKDPGGFEKVLINALGKAEQDKNRHLGDEDYLENEYLRHEPPAVLIPTGLSTLDGFLGGGFRDGVIILGGATSMGKTALAIHFSIEAAKKQKRVLYLTYELSKKQMWSRIFGVVMRKPFRDIHFDQDKDKYKDLYEKEVKELARYIKIREDYSFEDVERSAGNYHLVVVDYLQRMPPIIGEKSQEIRMRVTNLVHHLQKDVARRFNIPVLVLSSYSRSATEKPEPGITAYKESGDIEYTAQVAMGLWLKSKNQERSEEIRRRFNTDPGPVISLSVYKNTIGTTGDLDIRFTKRTGVFNETG
jgi:5S rRNA maturation endonuclease (ribonuclease M5)